MVNYADYRLVYVAVSAGQIFGFRKKNLLHEKLTTPSKGNNNAKRKKEANKKVVDSKLDEK